MAVLLQDFGTLLPAEFSAPTGPSQEGALSRWVWKLPGCENRASEKSLFRRHREDIEHEGLNIHIAVFRRELGAELDRLYRRWLFRV